MSSFIKHKNVFFYSFLFSFNCLFAQIIEGDLISVNGKTIQNGVLSIKENSDPDRIIEYKIINTSNFSYIVKENYLTILLELKVQGFKLSSYLIEKPSKSKKYKVEFELIPEDITDLEEVLIVAKEKPFKIKKDTLIFKVDYYKNEGDRKIEEVIRKLPGIEVNQNSGEIKFKGKSIETVTLEGDNLFGFNYTLGTKNINIDMVEEIEAIENYSENPLLKNIEKEGKVALNLKFKKSKVDLSGAIDIGSGVFEADRSAYLINSTLLALNQKFKSFSSFSYNNVGINYTPFDYFGNNLNSEQSKEKELYAQKAISEISFSNRTNEARAYFNKQYFGNFNSILKIGKRLSVKTNLYYLVPAVIQKMFCYCWFNKRFSI